MAIDTEGVTIGGDEQKLITGRNRSIIAEKATFLLKTGQGKMGRLIIQTVGTTWTITIYDALSAVSGKEIVQWVTADGKGPFTYDIPCKTGICVVSGGTTAGAATLVWD
ncbi:MAG: hypothetical protein AB7U18_01135 [Dehalococcoidia bacterium]